MRGKRLPGTNAPRPPFECSARALLPPDSMATHSKQTPQRANPMESCATCKTRLDFPPEIRQPIHAASWIGRPNLSDFKRFLPKRFATARSRNDSEWIRSETLGNRLRVGGGRTMGLRPKIESMKSSSSRTGAGGLGTRGSRGGSDDNRGFAVKENSAGKGEP